MSVFIDNKIRNLFIIIFLSCLTLPHGTGYYLNGLPFNNLSEIILFTVFLPYIYFFKHFFDDLKIKFIILFIFLFKIFLIFSPTNGIAINQYFVEKKNDLNFIKTFDTFWNKNNSYIQKFNFNKKEDFPIDWTFNSKLNAITKLDVNQLNLDIKNKKEINIFNYREHRFYDGKTYSNLPLNYKSNFVLPINENRTIRLETKGSEYTQIIVKDYKSKRIILNTSKTEFNLTKGIYLIEVLSNFRGDNWSNKIYKSDNTNKFKSIFKTRDIYLEKNFQVNFLKFFKISSYIYEILFLCFLIICLFKIIKLKRKELIISLLFIIVFFFQFYLLKNLIPNTGHLLQITFALNLIFLLILILQFKNLSKFNDIYFIVIVPLALGIFIFPNIENINYFGFWSLGDDWEWYQLAAREIVVDNVWVNDDEKYTIRRYAIRLIIAFYKIIFGKTFFPQLIFEVWAILLIGFLTYKIGRMNNLSKNFSVISSLFILVFFFGDNFRWLIGRGLTAYYSTFFIILLSYLICKLETLHLKNIFLISILGGFIIWLREDYAILVASLIFLIFKNNFDQNLNNFNFIKYSFFKNIHYISVYIFLLLFFTSLIFLKNYYSFGSFDSVHAVQSPIAGKIESYKNIFRSAEEHVEYYGSKNYWWHSLYRISFATDPGKFPRITSLFLIGSFFASIFLLLSSRKIYFLNRPGILMIPISIYFTYSLINNGAYSPRYCISFLPFAVIIFFIFVEKKLSIITQKRSFR